MEKQIQDSLLEENYEFFR